jgi:hypothetical protein
MEIIVSLHDKQEEKVLLAFLESLAYKYRQYDDYGKPQTIEEYNQEIEDAEAEIKAGKFITQDELEKEMQTW